jgi:hypothetical protein
MCVIIMLDYICRRIGLEMNPQRVSVWLYFRVLPPEDRSRTNFRSIVFVI